MNSKPKTHAERAATASTVGDEARAGQSVERPTENASNRRLVQSVDDVLTLLTWAAAYDRITRRRLEAEAWLETLRGHPVEAVKHAITEHYSGSRYPVMPSDIIQIIEEGNES